MIDELKQLKQLFYEALEEAENEYAEKCATISAAFKHRCALYGHDFDNMQRCKVCGEEQ